jgi:hypothetical protein
MTLKTMGLMGLYLAGIVAANLLVTHYGPWITPYAAFALIGADLTTRDLLHDRLNGWQRWLCLGALIAVGGLLSYLLNADAAMIAEASVIAFLAAAVVDTLVYQALYRADRDTRVNASNVAAAAVDSVLFLWVAFGVVNGITFTQFVAKVAGGAVWLLIFKAAGSRALLARHA